MVKNNTTTINKLWYDVIMKQFIWTKSTASIENFRALSVNALNSKSKFVLYILKINYPNILDIQLVGLNNMVTKMSHLQNNVINSTLP